jgi:hypothetical protein
LDVTVTLFTRKKIEDALSIVWITSLVVDPKGSTSLVGKFAALRDPEAVPFTSYFQNPFF